MEPPAYPYTLLPDGSRVRVRTCFYIFLLCLPAGLDPYRPRERVFLVPCLALRTQTASACTRCRDRRVGCDGNQPCARCIKRNEECVFEQIVEAPKKRPKSTVSSLCLLVLFVQAGVQLKEWIIRPRRLFFNCHILFCARKPRLPTHYWPLRSLFPRILSSVAHR